MTPVCSSIPPWNASQRIESVMPTPTPILTCSIVPDLQELSYLNWVPNGAHIAFSPIAPIRACDAVALYTLAKRHHQHFGIDLFPAFCVGLREMHLIVELAYDRADAQKRRDVLGCMRAMVDDAARLGYGEYRTHLVLMDQVAGTYSWNDGALLKFNERIKDCLDPNGILAPGRCGIWPQRYRGLGWEMVGNEGESSEGNGVGGVLGSQDAGEGVSER